MNNSEGREERNVGGKFDSGGRKYCDTLSKLVKSMVYTSNDQ